MFPLSFQNMLSLKVTLTHQNLPQIHAACQRQEASSPHPQKRTLQINNSEFDKLAQLKHLPSVHGVNVLMQPHDPLRAQRKQMPKVKDVDVLRLLHNTLRAQQKQPLNVNNANVLMLLHDLLHEQPSTLGGCLKQPNGAPHVLMTYNTLTRLCIMPHIHSAQSVFSNALRALHVAHILGKRRERDSAAQTVVSLSAMTLNIPNQVHSLPNLHRPSETYLKTLPS